MSIPLPWETCNSIALQGIFPTAVFRTVWKDQIKKKKKTFQKLPPTNTPLPKCSLKKMKRDKLIRSDEWEFKMEPEYHNSCKCSVIMESHGDDGIMPREVLCCRCLWCCLFLQFILKVKMSVFFSVREYFSFSLSVDVLNKATNQ